MTGGNVKLQWKPDFGARWAALDVDFEMYGKDHSTNTPIYDAICEILGGRAPKHFTYELFLDEKGEKISKSKGNGLTIDEWLTYAGPESLAYFMYGKPKTAKRLYFDVIPKNVDEYHQQLRAYPGQDAAARLANPVWHIHRGQPPASDMVVSFAMLLNLASAANAHDKGVLWGFIRRYAPAGEPGDAPAARRGGGARGALLRGLRAADEAVPGGGRARGGGARRPARAGWRPGRGRRTREALQNLVFAVGNEHGFDPLRAWFAAIYEVLLGAKQGPRFGGFIAVYGVPETIALIDAGLEGRLAAEQAAE